MIRPSKTEPNSQTWEEEPRSDTIAGVTVSSGCWLASCDPKFKYVARFVLAEAWERGFVGTDMVVNERLKPTCMVAC